MEFINLIAEHPHPEAISRVISNLHKQSAGTSPDGKFGFPVFNCHGKIVQPNGWDADWTRYCATLISAFYDADVAVNGTYPEYEDTFNVLKTHVIPRLLKPLQEDGRVLQPCLVHGDLWHENIGLRDGAGDDTDEDDRSMAGSSLSCTMPPCSMAIMSMSSARGGLFSRRSTNPTESKTCFTSPQASRLRNGRTGTGFTVSHS